MKISVVAYTSMMFGAFPGMDREEGVSSLDTLSEAAGRQCYRSFHKPNEATRANVDYLANILAQKHESVLEHASVSFRVSGVSRNLLLELERHRHLSFSVVSQRYVNATQDALVMPPALRNQTYVELEKRIAEFHREAKELYSSIVTSLTCAGLNRKQAREAARAVLPGGMETEFVVTGNLRAWRDVLRRRFSVHADAEICEMATEMVTHMRALAPGAFQDFPEVPFP